LFLHNTERKGGCAPIIFANPIEAIRQDQVDPSTNLLVVRDVPRLRPRAHDAHKGTFGNVLVIAGAAGMSGAAVLAGSAALRGGAGLERLAIPESIAGIVATSQTCYMTAAMPADEQGRLSLSALPILLELAAKASAVVVGPGLGQTPEVAAVVRSLVADVQAPLVLDADALNVLGQRPALLQQRRQPFLLTPHPGEFARLLASDTQTVQANRGNLAVAFANDFGGVLVLKGAGTLVTDGRRIYTNTTGNPGMASGGTGDVLAGLLGALLAQRMDPFEAAVLGVYLHGLAGDLARDQVTEVSLIATDLLEFLPAAFRAGNSGQAG
jgi:NAD(P)H-hydrate epimerase